MNLYPQPQLLNVEEIMLFESRSQRVDTRQEVERYNQTVIDDKADFDILAWWKAQEKSFPRLSQFAKQLIGISASASSERVFSKSNLIVTQLRNRLESEKAKALTYISLIIMR